MTVTITWMWLVYIFAAIGAGLVLWVLLMTIVAIIAFRQR